MSFNSRSIRELIEFLLNDNLCDNYVDFRLIIYKGVECLFLIFFSYLSSYI